MPSKLKNIRKWLIGFLIWLVALVFVIGCFLWVEKSIWGTWPPPFKAHYLHLVRGILIAFLTSLVAVAIIFRMKVSDVAKLQLEKAFSSELIESAHSLIVGLKTKGEILIFNKRLEELTDYSREEVIGKNWFELFIPVQDRKRVIATVENVIAQGSIHDYRNPILTRSGEPREILWNGNLIKDESGKPIGVLGIGADITEKRSLHEKVTLFSSAFEHSTDAILITDLEGKMIEVNQAFTKLFGYTREETLGSSTRILRSRYSTDAFYRQMWQSINTREEWKGEIINKAKDGSEIPVWLSITPIIDDGKKIGYMGIEMDMREKKELERRALEAERLAAVGKMSSQVAHEVRNPLSSISLNVELLREELENIRSQKDLDKIKESHSLLEAIEREVDRLSELAGDYLKFSRLPQHKTELTDCNELLHTLLDFLQEEARRRHVEIFFRPSEGLSPLSVDSKQIEQAVLNLVKNSFDAMPAGGKVEVGILREEEAAVIYVRDQGTGMDEETREKIFDPFFTTKERGSGLGLSLVRQVVAEHGGTIWCESVKGQGATFFMRIPTLVKGQVPK